MARIPITYSIVLPLLAGIALIALAIPRFLSGLPLSDPDPVLRTLADRETVDEKRLGDAARARLRSLAIVRSGRVSYELGLIRLHLARNAPDDLRQQLLAEASDDTRIGILANPAQPFAWMQLVQLSMLRNSDPGLRAAASYYPLAVSTGPETPELVLPRVEIALVLWGRLDENGRERARQQARLLAFADPDRLAMVARRRLALREVRALLSDTPELLGRFDSAYRHLRPDVR